MKREAIIDSGDRERDQVLHDLASPEEELRRLAVERVHSLPSSDAMPALLERLGDSSWRVRKAVVERLVASAENARVEDALIEALSDGDNSGRRNSAFEALVGIGRRLNGKLLAALDSDDVDVRKLLVDVIGGIGDPECAEAMVGVLADPDPNVRGAAADALGLIGNDIACGPLHAVAVRADEDPLVRLSALRGLANLEHALTVEDIAPVLDESLLRPAAFALLGQIGDAAAVSELMKGLSLPVRASREAAMSAMLRVIAQSDGARVDELLASIQEAARSTPDLISLSLERLEEADLGARIMLIQFLGLTADAQIVVPVLRAGRDEAVAEIAHATLESLGHTTVRALVSAWPELDLALRSDACRLMGAIGGPEGLDLLTQCLDDPDATLRMIAARALGSLHCIDALPDLLRRLEAAAQDEDPDADEEVDHLISALVELAPADEAGAEEEIATEIELLAARVEGAVEAVRLAAASVLGRIGRPADAELVARLLKDPSDRVRRAAVQALTRLDTSAASEPLRLALADESAMVRIAAANALGELLDPAVIEDLQRLLHDDDARVSAAAVRAIGVQCLRGHVEIETAVGLVEHALSADGVLGLAAIEALGTIGGPCAARAALAALGRSEPELVQAAVVCIGKNGDAETVGDLISVVSHPSWAVRAEVVQVLGERRIDRAVPAILRRLETEQDGFVRDTILRALRQLED